MRLSTPPSRLETALDTYTFVTLMTRYWLVGTASQNIKLIFYCQKIQSHLFQIYSPEHVTTWITKVLAYRCPHWLHQPWIHQPCCKALNHVLQTNAKTTVDKKLCNLIILKKKAATEVQAVTYFFYFWWTLANTYRLWLGRRNTACKSQPLTIGWVNLYKNVW